VAYDPAWLHDLFEPFGPVRLKRMFSGYGVYDGDFCIALAINPGLCVRANEEFRPALEAAGAQPFTYAKQGKTIAVKAWWRLPDDIVDDPDAVSHWARISLQIARSLPPKKPRAAAKARIAGKTNIAGKGKIAGQAKIAGKGKIAGKTGPAETKTRPKRARVKPEG